MVDRMPRGARLAQRLGGVGVSVSADIWVLEDSAWREGDLHRITGGRYTIRRAACVDDAYFDERGIPERVWFLDHDLCKATAGEPCPEAPRRGCGCKTGKDFVRRLLKGEWAWPELIIVHSGNIKRGNQMAHALNRRGIKTIRAPINEWSALSPTINAAIVKVLGK